MASTPLSSGIVLNSWKEIASHVGRGVRTVQRWERDLGMPVRRPRAKSRSAVIAMSDEIDAWLRSSPTTELIDRHDDDKVIRTSEPIIAFGPLRTSIEQHEDLRDRCFQLRLANREALARLIECIKSLQATMKVDMNLTGTDHSPAASTAD